MEKYTRETGSDEICEETREGKVSTVAMGVIRLNLNYLAVKYGDHRCPRKPVHLQWEAQDWMPSFDSVEITPCPYQLKK